MKWTVINQHDGNDTFDVDGDNYGEAACDALQQLGWAICVPDSARYRMKRKLIWIALIILVLPVTVVLFYGAVKSASYGDLTGILFLGSVLFASVVSGLAVALLNLPKCNADRRQKQPGGG
jgi:hypothetical protein